MWAYSTDINALVGVSID